MASRARVIGLGIVAALAAALALGGCSTASGPHRIPATQVVNSPRVPTERGPFAQAVHERLDATMVGGNHAELANDGTLFPAMLDAVRGARSSIDLDVFIWRQSEIGFQLADAVAERARAGVACRVVVDPFGTLWFHRIGKVLERAGCEVHLVRLPSEQSDESSMHRDHRKIVVVDGRVGFTGGFGIEDRWTGDGRHEDQFRDTNVRLEGPVVAQLQRAFEEDWVANGGLPLGAEAYPEIPKAGNAWAAVVTSRAPPHPNDIAPAEATVRFLIGAAKRRLWISNAYLVPSDEIVSMLEAKAREGVDVRVLVAGPKTDDFVAAAAQRATYPRLVAAGVKIFEYQPTLMHAKTILVDDRISTVGSINLDPFSLKKIEEDTVIIDDPAFAAQLAVTFVQDLAYSERITKPRKSAGEDLARSLMWGLGKHL